MSEAQWQTVITGIFTLVGVALGALGAYLQARNAATIEMEKDERQRAWSLQDFSRDRRLAIRDGRCQQAENFVSAMTEDFHQFRTHAIWIVSLDPAGPIPQELHEFAWWQKRIDKAVFQYGPVIAAISTQEYDLQLPWRKMEQAWKDMSAHYTFAYSNVIFNQTPIPDPSRMTADITAVYDTYNEAEREFIVIIDKIKSSSPVEQS